MSEIDMNEINKVLSKFLVERSKDETNGITLTSKAILDTRDKYLSRLDKFAEDYLGIKLTVYQKYILKNLCSNHLYIHCGNTKMQFIKFLYLCSKCILEPKSHILIVSNKEETGEKPIDFINRISDKGKNEISTIKSDKDETIIKFKNHSYIKVIKPQERFVEKNKFITDDIWEKNFKV